MTTQNQAYDLTPAMQEMQAQLAQLRAELAQLKHRAQTLPPVATPPLAKPPSTLAGSRRKTLKRLGLALLGGAAAATVTGFSVSEAKVIVSPTLGTGTTTSKAGAIVIPPGAAVPINNPPSGFTGFNYGLIASSDTSALDLSTLPSYDTAVFGSSPGGYGVYGSTSDGTGVSGTSTTGAGVIGTSTNYTGVAGSSTNWYGVAGYSTNGFGVAGSSSTGYAGYFSGKVHIGGPLEKPSGSFKIDHPLDPANKYLYHSFVESPDMLNIYNGNVTLDQQGEATVTMPAWFEALNSDFRYQLTSIGSSMPDLFIAQEIKNRQFKIGGGKAGQRVSWMVTGIRQDEWAKAHRIPVEVEKTGDEKGKYLHPELFGQSEEKSVGPRPPIDHQKINQKV